MGMEDAVRAVPEGVGQLSLQLRQHTVALGALALAEALMACGAETQGVKYPQAPAGLS